MRMKKGCDRIISYRPFWETLKRKQLTQYQLIHTHNFSTGTLDALRKGRSITLNTLEDICKLLNCDITDVVEFLPPLVQEEPSKQEDSESTQTGAGQDS